MSQNYALGHSEIELARLARQAALIDPITRRYCNAAGIGPGMRVLDIGSGVGDVAMLLAALVGPNGEVIGTDRSGPALAIARRRATEAGLRNVAFLEGDPSQMVFDRPFDAIAGRYILQFLPDPAAFLRKLASHVKPGGVVVFHELDWDGARSSPSVESYDACCRWCAQTVRRLGADTRMGAKLHSVFEATRLTPVATRLEAVIGTGTSSIEVVHLVTDLAQSLRHQLEAGGVPLETAMAFTDLFERVRNDTIRGGSTLMGRSEIGVWSRA
jgi:ubiquinone/menaquinone biosynthesis C-methylase UbiE